MTEKRRSALKRARGIINRLEKVGYKVNVDLKSMSTRKIQNISRKSLIQNNIAVYQDPEETTSMRSASTYNSSGHNITRSAVLPSSGTKEKIEMIYKILDYGRNYMGERSKRDKSGAIFVQTSAKRLKQVITSAVRSSSVEEVISKIEARYGSIEKFGELLERLVLAIYDEFYASWAIGGDTAYEAEVIDITRTIGGTDFGF